MNVLLTFLTVILLCSAVSCQTGFLPASQRSLGGIPKMGTDKAVGNSRPIGRPGEQSPEYYVKNKAVTVVPKKEKNSTGSLFNIEDSRNYFFAARPPVRVGSHIDVKVDTNLLEKKKSQADDPTADAKKNDNFGEIEQAIIESLPDLSPKDDKNAKLLKQFKVKVAHQYPNGDVLVRYKRGSIVDHNANEINVTARIANENLVSGNLVRTTDLTDVNWTESRDGELIQRYSATWEDEYSARISGFDESKSSVAMDLESKRKQLEESKKRLESRLQSMGSERAKLAKEREDLYKAKANSDGEVKELKDKAAEQAEEIENLKSELEGLRPAEDKPGARRDGADGP